MSLMSTTHRYRITVSSAAPKKAESQKSFLHKVFFANIWRKIAGLLVVLSIVGISLLSTAPSAKADWITDGFKGFFCSGGYQWASPEARGLGPNTVDGKIGVNGEANFGITAYEKYGMAGLTWTTFLGVEEPGNFNDDNGKGKFAGTDLVNLAGGVQDGKSPLDSWANGTKDKLNGGGDGWRKYDSFFNVGQACGLPGENALTGVANFTLGVTSWVVHISNLTFQTAYETSSSVLKQLNPVLEKIVIGLKDSLYLEFISVAVILGALYMAYKGWVKKAATEAASAAIWMVGSAIVGLFLLINPLFLPNIINSTVSAVTQASISGITSVVTKTDGSGTSNAQLCDAGAATDSLNSTDSNNKPIDGGTRRSVRQIQCTMWYSFMYTPWAIGEFGSSPSAVGVSKDNKLMLPNNTIDYIHTNGDLQGAQNPATPELQPNKAVFLGNKKLENPGWAIYQVDNKVNYPGSNKINQQRGMIDLASVQLLRDQPNIVWKGVSSQNRITTAGLALISSVGAGAMIIILSMSMIVLEIGVVILTLLSAFFLLVGVHPGMGRRIALGWLETLVGLALKRIVLSILLAVMITFYSVVLNLSANMDWLVSMILVIAISIGGLTYKNQILGMFNNISFGGNGGMSAQPIPGAARLRAAGLGSGKFLAAGAVGGVLGAVVGGAGARKANRSAKHEAQAEAAKKILNKNTGEGDENNEEGSGAGNRPSGNPDASGDAANGAEALPTAEGAGAGARPVDKGNDPRGEALNAQNREALTPEQKRELDEAIAAGAAGGVAGAAMGAGARPNSGIGATMMGNNSENAQRQSVREADSARALRQQQNAEARRQKEARRTAAIIANKQSRLKINANKTTDGIRPENALEDKSTTYSAGAQSSPAITRATERKASSGKKQSGQSSSQNSNKRTAPAQKRVTTNQRKIARRNAKETQQSIKQAKALNRQQFKLEVKKLVAERGGKVSVTKAASGRAGQAVRKNFNRHLSQHIRF